MMMTNQTIGGLVEGCFSRAAVLDRYGIRFFEHEDQTLEQACNRYGIDVGVLCRAFEQNANVAEPLFLNHTSIDLVIKYLRHIHQYFIKFRLPFFARIIDSLQASDFETHAGVIEDLQLIYPLFSRDYISHIYQEEDTFFEYVETLLAATRHIQNPGVLCLKMRKYDIRRFAVEHESHEEEMDSIRQMISLVRGPAKTSLRMQVLAAELAVFAGQLSTHATIENTILFPKALRLESEVCWRIDQKAKEC